MRISISTFQQYYLWMICYIEKISAVTLICVFLDIQVPEWELPANDQDGTGLFVVLLILSSAKKCMKTFSYASSILFKIERSPQNFSILIL